MVFSFGNMTVWTILGLLLLVGSCYMSFRQGQGSGHEACSVSRSIERAIEGGKAAQVTPKMYKQAWSRSTAVKSVFAGALIGYVINVVYIILSLVDVNETVLLVSRLISWIVVMPYWPILNHWYETYTMITPSVVALLMISPFIIPACHALGYMCGPRLWAQTEKAMADGRRRAKARSRIVKKNRKPKVKGPEI